MSKPKKRKPYNANPAKQYTEGVSYKEEADIDYKDGLEALRKYQDCKLTYYLREAGKRLKMAAERYDNSEKLLGNTLEPYVEEEK